MERGIAHLKRRLRSFPPAWFAPNRPGALTALALYDLNEDALHGLRRRQERPLGHVCAVRRRIARLNRKTGLATICGMNPGRIEQDSFSVVQAWFAILAAGLLRRRPQARRWEIAPQPGRRESGRDRALRSALECG